MYIVYKITNKDTGRAYIGMTSWSAKDRLTRHIYLLRQGSHPNMHLTQDWQLGNTTLAIKTVARYENKADALAHETRLTQRQRNPYNIKTGRPGAMKGYAKHRFKNGRAYLYSEIVELHRTHSLRELIARYGCGGPMISMIGHGHRYTREAPQTSFDDVYFDDETTVMARRVARSQLKKVYAGASRV